MSEDNATLPQVIARVTLALALTILGAWTVRGFMPALVWAPTLAIAVWPTYQRACRRWPPGRHNILMPSLFTLAIALLFIIPLILVAVQAGKEVHGIYDAIDKAQTEGVPPPDWLKGLPVGSQEATAWWKDNLENPASAKQLLRRARPAEIVSSSKEIGASVVHRVVLFASTLLALFFVFRHGDSLAAQMLRASNRAFGPSGERIGRQMINSVHGTVDGLVLVGLGIGFIMGIAYVFFGVPRPTLFGLFTGLAAIVPLGGPFVFFIAAATILIKGQVVGAISIAVLGMLITFFADHFVRPILIGSSTRLPFLWVLLGILGGVETWGILGLFLGPAIMAALILLWREWAGNHE